MPELVTLDSSVIVAALRRQEEHYSECQSLLEKVRDGDYVAVEPYTVLIEIAAAIKRRTGSQKHSERVTKNLLAIDTIHFLDLDAARAKRAIGIAQLSSIRGMDAIVVQVAEEFGATLVSPDAEMLDNVEGLVEVRTPHGMRGGPVTSLVEI